MKHILQRLVFLLKIARSVIVAHNPLRLDDIAMVNIKDHIEDYSTVKILEKIYPNIFSIEEQLTETGFMKVFLKNTISLSRIDVSNLSIERLPRSIVNRISSLEVLDLSGNTNIKLNEDWFDQIIKNNKILELSIRKCDLTKNVFDMIEKIETLERLNISGNKDLNIRTEPFRNILKRVKYLDISDCNLNEESLQFILENAENLLSLDYSKNTLSCPFQRIVLNINRKTKNKLEVLNLADCNLNSDDLDFIFIFENLKEINLSDNNFGNIESGLLRRLFKCTNCSEDDSFGIQRSFFNYIVSLSLFRKKSRVKLPQNTYVQNLRCITLKNCRIQSNKFIACLFELEGLELLDLSQNPLIDFDRAILNSNNIMSSLKRLELSECKISNPSIFEKLNRFNCLEYLNISRNYMGRLLDDFDLENLKYSLIYLNINGCCWNNNGLKAIAKCTKLEQLHASASHFANIPRDFDFQELKNSLKEVHIPRSQMSIECLNALTECSSIEKLVMYENSMPRLPSDFSLKNLENSLIHLNINRCDWDSNGLKAIFKCTRLEYLYAGDNNFRNLSNDFILTSGSLKKVYLNDCKMNYFGLVALTHCSCIEVLDVSFNHFDNLPYDFTLGSLRNSLRDLRINKTGLTDQHLKAITDCFKLTHLDAGGNVFSDERIHLGISRNSLVHLSLNNCKLNYEILRTVTDCPRLRFLNVVCNVFSNVPDDFELGCSKDSLIDLNISITRLNYNGLRAVTDCSKLERLTALMNSFRNIPDNFTFGRSKHSLRQLDISWSKLNANGLKAITECSKLEELWASRSKIESIPEHFDLGYLKDSLRIVDLNFSTLDPLILSKFNYCKNVKRIDVSNCEFRSQRALQQFTIE